MYPVLKQSRLNGPALVGLVMLLPTLSFFGMVASKYLLGINFLFAPFERAMFDPVGRGIINFLSPIVFIGGSFSALIINLLAVAGLKFHRESDSLVSTLVIKGNLWNLSIVILSFTLISMLLGYLVAENWQCWVGLKENC